MQNRSFRFGNSLLPLSFAGLILLGALLLKLPGMLEDRQLSWIDALFTSCSAVCLNGLAVIPTSEFSFSGQLVLLVLIQIGCFGIVSLSAIVLLMAGKGLSFSNNLVMYKLNDSFSRGGTEALVRTIAIYTLVSEAAGFVLMLPGFLMQGFGWNSIWYALFYSVGSFCNSGMGPLPGGIADAGRYVQTVSMVQIVLGGIGVYVIYDLLQKFSYGRDHRIRLHSRIVLTVSTILILGGAIFLWVAARTSGESSLEMFDALYLSVAARTAGYNTVDVGALPVASIVIVIVLMFIGGSPGSTAGGIKTTTAAVALAALVSSFKGEGEVLIAHRSIAWRSVLRAFTIIVIFLLLALVGATMIRFSGEVHGLSSTFEAVSALSATGLTTGTATQQLLPGSRLLVVLFMFIGRVGPLSIIMFFVGREKPGHLRYPEERVVIG